MFDAQVTKGLLDQARAKLRPPAAADPALRAVAAAAFFAVAALGFAATSVLAPTPSVGQVARHAPR